jgi:hypothetical protein
MPQLRLDKQYPVLVSPTESAEITIKNLSPGKAYYKQEPAVSSTNNSGELTEGQELTINARQDTWFIGSENGIILSIAQTMGENEESVTTSDLQNGAVTLGKLAATIKESGAVEIAAAPKAESEITESGTGNGEKEPSKTKPVQVYVKYKTEASKASTVKIEVGAVIVYEYTQEATAGLAQENTASFVVPKGVKFKVTFANVKTVIPTYHIL